MKQWTHQIHTGFGQLRCNNESDNNVGYAFNNCSCHNVFDGRVHRCYFVVGTGTCKQSVDANAVAKERIDQLAIFPSWGHCFELSAFHGVGWMAA